MEGTSPESLSYSLFLDHIKTRGPPVGQVNQLDHVRSRVSPSWVPDDAVTTCYLCKKSFSLWRRKHHCRACARIFCYECSSKSIVLPEDLDSYPEGPRNGSYMFSMHSIWFSKRSHTDKYRKKERVCDRCYDRFTEIYSLDMWIRIFKHLELPDLACVSRVSKQWNRAANVCRTLFRDTQYILPGYSMSPIQDQLLKINRKYISGHSRWLVKLLDNLDWTKPDDIAEVKSILFAKRKVKCWSLMCTRLCNSEISGFEVIELLQTRILDLQIRRFVISRLDTLSDEEFECAIPQITFGLRHELSGDSTLLDLLVKRSVNNSIIRTYAYWYLVVLKSQNSQFTPFYNLFLAKLDEALGRTVVYNELLQGRRFYKILSGMPADKHKARQHLGTNLVKMNFTTEITPFTFKESLCLPIDPSLKVISIIADEISTKDSVTSPILIPLLCVSDSEHNKVIRKDILYKPEDLLKDNVMMNIIRLMDRILKRDENIDFGIVTYRVIPTDVNGGFIEIIPKAETLYSIQNRMQFTIQNFLLEHNKDVSITEIRERFIKSAAAYCVISYLLGVGDRHLDNIMVTTNGHLFHIDYGFILGYDPKPMSPAMRITQGIVDAMGGTNSTDFQAFKQYCTRIYNCLRRYTHLFLALLNILTEDGLNLDAGKYKKDRLKEEILSRFVPSENASDAESQILLKIDTSFRSTTPRLFIDFVHYHMKETLTLKPSSLTPYFWKKS